MVQHGLEILSSAECYRLLRQRSLGRVGIVVDGTPAILPVRYRVVKGAVLFRAAEGTRLSTATRDAMVVFEADWFDELAHQGWSVVALGRSAAVDTDAEVGSGLLRPWAPGRRHHLVSIRVDAISGRRIEKRRLMSGGWGPPAAR